MKKALPYILLGCSFLLVTLFWYYGLFSLFGLIISEFATLTKVLPLFLLSFVLMTLFFFYFHDFLIKKVGRVSRLVLGIILSLLTLGSIILIVINAGFYFKNPVQIDRAIFAVLFILFDIPGIVFLLLGRYVPEFDMVKPDETKTWKYILTSLFGLLAIFFLADFFIGLTLGGNYSIHPFFYPVLLLCLLLPAFDYCYLLYARRFKKVISYIFLCLNILFLVAIAVIAFNPLVLPDVGQGLFPLDYMGSKGFAPVFLAILFVTTIVKSCLVLFGKKKETPMAETEVVKSKEVAE